MANEQLIKDIVDELEYFDTEGYLESRGIEYWTEGKNVTVGWINTKCLWCQDPSNHLGINIDSKNFNCWICPKKGSMIKFILKIEKCPLKDVLQIVKKFRTVISNREKSLEYERLTERKQIVTLPIVAKKELLPIYQRFLVKRGFDPEYIFKKYNLYCNGPIGYYKHRLIIPFFRKGRLVTFVARDVTEKSPLPYKNQPIQESVLSAKETLYNIDNCNNDSVLVFEGVTDVWKVGDDTCATEGTKWTIVQLAMLTTFKRVFILFDTEPEAQENAERLSYNLSPYVPHVEILELDELDPGAMSEDDVKHLRKEIFGKIYS